MLANQVDQLLHLTLKPTEMEHIVSYLKNVNKPMSHDLLVLHYLQQSKFTDAIQLEAVSSATTVSVLNIISGAGQMRIVEIFLR